MAARYAVNITGTVNWNGSNTAIWSTTSGGASGASVPGLGDDVFLDGSSGTGTIQIITNTANCHSFDATGFTGTLAASGTRTWNVGGAATDTTAAVFTLGSGMTFSGGGTLTVTLDNRSGGLTVTSNGITMNGINTWQTGTNASTVGATYADTTNIGAATWEVQRGTNALTSGTSMTCGNFTVLGTGTKTVNYSGATINCSSWSIAGTVANCTLTTNGSSDLNVTGAGQVFASGNKTYSGSVDISGGGSQTMTGTPTFSTLTVTSSAAKNDSFIPASTVVVTGTLVLAGNSQVNRLQVRSGTYGTAIQFTVTGATVTGQLNVDFMDVTMSGATASGTSVGDGGGNSGITFTGAVTRYWISGTGNVSDTSHWSTSSGGSSGASMPIAQDTAVFDSNSFSAGGQTATWDEPLISNIDASLATNFSHTISLSNSTITQYFMGNVTMAAQTGLTTQAQNYLLAKRGGTQTWTQNGGTITPGVGANLHIRNLSGTFQPQDSFTWRNAGKTASIVLINGTFNPLGDVTASIITDSGAATRAFTGTSGKTLSYNGTGVVHVFASGATVTGGSMNIHVTDTSANAKAVFLSRDATETWGNFVATPGSGEVQPTCARASGNTNLLSMSMASAGACTINFITSLTGTSYTLTNPTFFQGTAGNIITIRSSTAANNVTISCASTVSTDYIDMADNTAAGAGINFYAGANSTDNGDNPNWTFTAPPGGTVVRDMIGSMLGIPEAR